MPAAVFRGPSHIRIIATGSAGQNISGDAIRVGGGTTAGNSTCFAVAAVLGAALFLRDCRRLAVDLPAFFDDFFGRGFLALRICFCHLLDNP